MSAFVFQDSGDHDMDNILNWFISGSPAGSLPTSSDTADVSSSTITMGTCAAPTTTMSGGSNIQGGTFQSTFDQTNSSSDTISGGTFQGAATLLNCAISGGSFNSTVSMIFCTFSGGSVSGVITAGRCTFTADPGATTINSSIAFGLGCSFTGAFSATINDDSGTFSTGPFGAPITTTNGTLSAGTYNSSVTATNSALTDTSISGGAFLTNCTAQGNSSLSFTGGGTFTNCTISGTSGTSSGSTAIHLVSSQLTGGTSWGDFIVSGSVYLNTTAPVNSVSFGLITGVTTFGVNGVNFDAAWPLASVVKSGSSIGSFAGQNLGTGTYVASGGGTVSYVG